MSKNYNSMVMGRDAQLRKEKIAGFGFLSNKWLFSMVLLFGLLFTGFNASAQISVSGGTGLAASYTSFTKAGGLFAALNATAQTGNNIVVSITADVTTEDGVTSLNAGAWTTINITPSGARTISGTVAGAPMINFSGADNVTINGLNSAGNSLVISNLSTASTTLTSTIRFIGGATGNTITNCSVLGSATVPVGTNGGNIMFHTDANTTAGNDNNTVSNCTIGPAGSNLPTKGIYGSGSTSTTAIGNSGITITNNNFVDIFGAAVTSSAIYINDGCNGWSITNNKFYQTATRTWTTGALHNAMNINSTTATQGAQNFTITGNIIGYASSSQTGTYTLTGSTGSFVAIRFNGITGGTISNINNNTIAAVSLTGVTSSGSGTSSPFTGILVVNGLANTNGNTIGSLSATGSLTFTTNTTTATDAYGIYNFSSDNWTSNSNNIGGIAVTNSAASGTFLLYGLRANTGTSVTWTAGSNTIGGTVANSMSLNATGVSSQVVGMFTSNAGATLTSNTIRNLTTNIGTGTTSGASVIGINLTSSSLNNTVSQNTIFNLSNTNSSAASVVTGLQFTGSTAGNVLRNNIYNLSASSTSASAEINGIRISGGTTTYANNMIALGTGVANAVQINGVNEPSATGTDTFYHNSIYIGGSPTAGTGNSFAFNSLVTTSTRNFRDNIFSNARSNSGATGKNYAVQVGGTAANPAGLTINYNIYNASGTGGVFGRFNAADVTTIALWKSGVGQDVNSIAADPAYADATNATTPDLHIHATNPSPAEASGVAIGTVSDDFDGQTRSGLTPTDIGADAGNFVAAPSMTYVSSTAVQLTANSCANDNRTQILRMEVVTSGALNPLTLTSLTVNHNGTTNFADLQNWRIFYTGTSNVFNNSNPIAAASTTFSNSNTVVTPSSTVTLSPGTNYFWLTYNINPTVTGGDVLDAEFTSVALSTGGGTPTVTAPAGSVPVFNLPTVGVSPTSATYCIGGSAVTLTGSGASTYAWAGTGTPGLSAASGNPVTSTPTTATVITVTGTDANGCVNTATSSISLANTPAAATTTPYSICSGGTVPGGEGLLASTPVSGSQTLNFTVSGQPTETNSAPGNIVASASMSAIPASATITGVTINYANLTALGTSFRSDIKLGLSGALVNAAASDPAAASSAGNFNYTRTATTGITATLTGGTVNLLYWDSVSDNTGAEATFPTGTNVASVTVNYTMPATTIKWYDLASGGTQLATGSPFNPVGVDPALPNTNTPGNYTYYAESSIGGSCPATRTAAVFTVSSGAVVTVDPVATAKCAGQTATFSVTATGPGLTYQWTKNGIDIAIGGNASAGTATLSLTNVQSGDGATYAVRVTASCGSPVTSNGALLTVNALPNVQVTPTTGTYCTPGGAAVSLTASGATSYSWAGTGTPGLSGTTGTSITATPSTATTITVTGTDGNTCTNTATASLTVAAAITMNSVTATPDTVCSGSNSQLLANASLPNTTASSMAYTTGTSQAFETITTPTTVTALTSGTIDDGYITLTPASFTFNYLGTNAPSFTVGTNGYLIFGGTSTTVPTSLTNITGNIVFAFGRDGNLNTTNSGSLTHGPAAGGKYVFQMNKNAGGASGVESATAYVSYQYVLWGSTSAQPGRIDIIYGTSAGTPATTGFVGIRDAAGTFVNGINGSTSNSTTGSATWPASGQRYTFAKPTPSTYLWTPSTFIAGQESLSNPVATAVTATTVYNVTASQSGCSATGTVTVTVASGAPTVNITPAGPINLCGAATQVLTANVTGAGPFNYAWTLNGISTGGNTATLTANATGNYQVTVTDFCSVPSTASNIVAVTSNPNPTATASASTPVCTGGNINLTVTTGTGTGFVWTGPNSYTSSAQNPTISGATAVNAGIYTVVVTGPGGCTASSSTASVVVNQTPTGVTATASPTSLCAGNNINLTSGYNPASIAPVATGMNSYTATRTTGTTFTSIIPATTITSWRNTTPGAVSGGMSDDNLSDDQPVGFPFNYGGVAYSTFRVSTNGFITFDTTSTTNGTSGAPYGFTNSWTTSPTGLVLAPNWDDLQTASNVGSVADLNASINYTTTGTAGSRVLTVEWKNMQDFNTSSTASYNMQVKLYEADNHVEFVYGTMTQSAATVSYSLGLSGATVSTTPTAPQLLSQTTQNSSTFGFTNANSLTPVPATNTTISFSLPTLTPTYAWSGPNGFSSSAANPTVSSATTNASGVYNLTVTNPLNNCTSAQASTASVTVLPNYTITVTAGSNGSITPAGPTTVCSGGSQAYTIAANPGYHIVDVLVDTVSQGAVTSYTFSNVTADHSISATFAPDCTVPSLSTTQTNISCLNATGSATVNTTGGSSPFTYLWNDPSAQTTATATGLAAGTYNVVVTATGGCTANSSVTITSNTTAPSTPSITPSGGTLTCTTTSISATASSTGQGTISYSWSGGTTPATAANSFSTAGTYTVTATDSANGCTSNNSIVIGSNTTPPTVNASATPSSICAGNSSSLSATGTANTYVWNPGSLSGANQTVSPSGTTTYTVTGTDTSNGCTAQAQATVTVTAQPQWFLDADNDHYYTGTAISSCTSPGAGYTTSGLLGGGDCADNNAAINPGATEICYNNIDDNCNTTLSEGCAPVVVNMTPSYNNTTLPSLATAVPAVAYTYAPYTNLKYRFKITNLTTGAAPVEVTQASRYVTIPASLHAYNCQYTITASAVINEEVVPYAGNTITVNSPSVTLITLTSANCGATLASLTSTLAANPGLNATGYTFRIRLNDTNPSPTYAFSQSGTRFINANSFTGFPLQYSTSYKVAVQFTFNDPVLGSVQSGYGAECIVNTPGIPLISMASPTCGSQVSAINANISSQVGSYATGYQFRIRLFNDNGPTPTYYYSIPNASRFSSLTAFQGITLAYNTPYSISVQYSILNGSTTVWSGYGPECKVTTPFFPTTSLVPSQCGLSTATSLTQQLNITPYPGFPHYMVKLEEITGEDVTNSQEIEIAYSYFRLNQFSIAELNKNYAVSVKIKLNGVFGDYDTACDLFTPVPGKTEVAVPFKATAYPNPFANNFMLDVKSASQSNVNVKVYDMVGRLIEQREVRVSDMGTATIGDQYPTGVYNVVVSQEDSVQTVRVVKR